MFRIQLTRPKSDVLILMFLLLALSVFCCQILSLALKKVGVIGTGIAGLVCANILTSSHEVVVYEKESMYRREQRAI